MRPKAVVEQSLGIGLDAVAICDHNSAENVSAFRKAAEGTALQVLGGMEIASREEVHILALFDDDSSLLEMQALIYAHLGGTNDEKHFGPQEIVNESGEVTGHCEKLLIGATDLTIEKIVDAVHGLSGVAIAAHIDREAFSIIGQLGFISKDLELDAVELSPRGLSRIEAFASHGLPIVTASDAHTLDGIGRAYTVFLAEDLSCAETRMALSGKDGRSIRA